MIEQGELGTVLGGRDPPVITAQPARHHQGADGKASRRADLVGQLLELGFFQRSGRHRKVGRRDLFRQRGTDSRIIVLGKNQKGRTPSGQSKNDHSFVVSPKEPCQKQGIVRKGSSRDHFTQKYRINPSRVPRKKPLPYSWRGTSCLLPSFHSQERVLSHSGRPPARSRT